MRSNTKESSTDLEKEQATPSVDWPGTNPRTEGGTCRGCGREFPVLNEAGICSRCAPYMNSFEGRRDLRGITGYDMRRRKHHFRREVEGCKSEGDLSWVTDECCFLCWARKQWRILRSLLRSMKKT